MCQVAGLNKVTKPKTYLAGDGSLLEDILEEESGSHSIYSTSFELTL